MNIVNSTKQEKEEVVKSFLRRFRNNKKFWNFSITLWVIIIVSLAVVGVHILKIYAIMLPLALGVMGVRLALDNKFLKDFIAIYDEGCDPKLALEIMNRSQEQKTSLLNYWAVFKYCKANFLLALGRYEESRQVVEVLKSKKKMKKMPLQYCLLQFAYHESNKDLESALKVLDRAKKLVLVGESKIKEQSRIDYMMSIMETSIAILQKDYVKAKELLLYTLETRTEMAAKVSCQYNLGYIAIQLDHLEEAKERLQYVIANGNTLHLVKLAKELMDEHRLSD